MEPRPDWPAAQRLAATRLEARNNFIAETKETGDSP
jgi:hypothetical protein